MVLVYLAEGFEEIEALTPIDVLRRGGLDVKTVSMGDSPTVAGAHGVPVVCDTMFEESQNIDAQALILPGGMPGSTNLLASKALLQRLRDENAKGTTICAICAAPMVLAGAGILTGRTATIHPGMEPELGEATACADRVCIDRNLITSQGPATAMSFAFAILEALTDAALSQKIKGDMLVEG